MLWCQSVECIKVLLCRWYVRKVKILSPLSITSDYSGSVLTSLQIFRMKEFLWIPKGGIMSQEWYFRLTSLRITSATLNAGLCNLLVKFKICIHLIPLSLLYSANGMQWGNHQGWHKKLHRHPPWPWLHRPCSGQDIPGDRQSGLSGPSLGQRQTFLEVPPQRWLHETSQTRKWGAEGHKMIAGYLPVFWNSSSHRFIQRWTWWG